MRKHSNLSADVTQASDKAVQNVVQAMQQAGQAVGAALAPVADGLSVLAFLSRNWLWIAGTLAVGWVYVEYRKIDRED